MLWLIPKPSPLCPLDSAVVIPSPASRRLLFGGLQRARLSCPSHVHALSRWKKIYPLSGPPGALSPLLQTLTSSAAAPWSHWVPTGHCFKVPGHTHILGPMSPAGSKPQTTTPGGRESTEAHREYGGQREHGGTQSMGPCSLPCGQVSDMATGPKLHLWHLGHTYLWLGSLE